MAILLSVNVGRPRSLRVGERTVRTAIGKEPALGRVRAGRTNLDGDRQADRRVHGGPNKAVYAYDLSGYAHWEAALGRPLSYGQFGENLTVEGLPETEVRIDDVYRAGSALPPGLAAALALLQAGAPRGKPGLPRRLPYGAAGPASTCECSRRETSAPATRSRSSSGARVRSPS